MKSRWCWREMSLFLDQRNTRENRTTSQVFPIEIDRVKVPRAVEDIIRLRFWKPHPQKSEETERLGFPLPRRGDRPYWGLLNSLVCDLAFELQRLKEFAAARARGVPGPMVAETRCTVFLAEVSDDLITEHASLRAFLAEEGIQVLPRLSYPRDERRVHSVALRADLKGSVLFVQLLSGKPGGRLDDSPTGWVVLQHRVATAVGTPILQWCDPAAEIDRVTDADHVGLLKGPVSRTNLVKFRQAVVDRIKELTAPKPAKPVDPVLGPKAGGIVLVDAEPVNDGVADRIGNRFRELGVGAVLPFRTGDPMRDRKAIDKIMSMCDALVLVHDNRTEDPTWLLREWQRFVQIRAAHNSPPRVIAIYDGPQGPGGCQLDDPICPWNGEASADARVTNVKLPAVCLICCNKPSNDVSPCSDPARLVVNRLAAAEG